MSKEKEAPYDQQWTIFLKIEQLQLYATIIAMSIDLSFFDHVRAIRSMDSLILNIKHHSNKDHNKFKFINNILYFEECLYIPIGSLYLKVFQTCHDFWAAKNLRFNKILKFISQDFLWFQM